MISKRLARLIAILLIIPQATYGIALPQLPHQYHRIAGQDTLNQSSSTVIVTNPNAFTKQHHTITDTYASLDNQGSTAQGNSIKISSGGDTPVSTSM